MWITSRRPKASRGSPRRILIIDVPLSRFWRQLDQRRWGGGRGAQNIKSMGGNEKQKKRNGYHSDRFEV